MKKCIALLGLLVFLLVSLTACIDWMEDVLAPLLPAAEEPVEEESVWPAWPGTSEDIDEENGEDLTEPPALVDGFTVVYDLPEGLNLIDHDLAGSALLEHAVLTNMLGMDVAAVTIVREAETIADRGYIFNDAWAIELYYFSRRHETAVETVAWSVNWDMEEGYFFEDSILTLGDIRATADGQTAVMAVFEELRSGHVRICLYLAQNVPDSNEVVLLDMALLLWLWEDHDHVVLAELSQHIGIDLGTYIDAFVPGFRPPERL